MTIETAQSTQSQAMPADGDGVDSADQDRSLSRQGGVHVFTDIEHHSPLGGDGLLVGNLGIKKRIDHPFRCNAGGAG